MKENNVKTINNKTKNGQTKCPKCGASNVTFDKEKQKIICNYCKEEYAYTTVDGKEEAGVIEGDIRGSATKDIDNNKGSLITIKCDGCGAEIVINTDESLNAKCHWCGSSLSINHQIDNGVVPDEILPFRLTREQAFDNMMQIAKKKLHFSQKCFKKSFSAENIRGVFFSYLIVDAKAHGKYSGVGEYTTDVHYVHHGDDEDTYYDADVYHIEREFDIVVDDFTIESNFERLDIFNIKQKNSVINAIMPFDTQNCIQFNANYMGDYTSEKRDVDIHEIEGKVYSEINDIARNRINNSIKKYDRGVRWENEELFFSGKQWLTAYLPVWLYSCLDKKGALHYIAVNARTGETVGSIPFDRPKLFMTMAIIALVCFIPGIIFLYIGLHNIELLFGSSVTFILMVLSILLFGCGLLIPIILFIIEDYKYGNLVWKRHHYEKETKCDLKYTNCVDIKTDEIHRTKMSYMSNANNMKIHGDFIKINKNTK